MGLKAHTEQASSGRSRVQNQKSGLHLKSGKSVSKAAAATTARLLSEKRQRTGTKARTSGSDALSSSGSGLRGQLANCDASQEKRQKQTKCAPGGLFRQFADDLGDSDIDDGNIIAIGSVHPPAAKSEASQRGRRALREWRRYKQATADVSHDETVSSPEARQTVLPTATIFNNHESNETAPASDAEPWSDFLHGVDIVAEEDDNITRSEDCMAGETVPDTLAMLSSLNCRAHLENGGPATDSQRTVGAQRSQHCQHSSSAPPKPHLSLSRVLFPENHGGLPKALRTRSEEGSEASFDSDAFGISDETMAGLAVAGDEAASGARGAEAWSDTGAFLDWIDDHVLLDVGETE
ncbi:unnamed protein product [Jaminaea pallidilutea]